MLLILLDVHWTASTARGHRIRTPGDHTRWLLRPIVASARGKSSLICILVKRDAVAGLCLIMMVVRASECVLVVRDGA